MIDQALLKVFYVVNDQNLGPVRWTEWFNEDPAADNPPTNVKNGYAPSGFGTKWGTGGWLVLWMYPVLVP